MLPIMQHAGYPCDAYARMLTEASMIGGLHPLRPPTTDDVLAATRHYYCESLDKLTFQEAVAGHEILAAPAVRPSAAGSLAPFADAAAAPAAAQPTAAVAVQAKGSNAE